jgi:threonine dehydratase
MEAALLQRKQVMLPAGATIADGIAVRQVGEQTLDLALKYVQEMVTVDDEEIARAILRLLETQKMLAEGAAAVGIAALLHGKTTLRGKKVAVVISGGNIDVTLLAHIIERGLVKDGRLVRLRITLPDHPGGLERLYRRNRARKGEHRSGGPRPRIFRRASGRCKDRRHGGNPRVRSRRRNDAAASRSRVCV